MCLSITAKEDSYLERKTMAIKVVIVVCFRSRMYAKVYRQVCDLQITFLKGVDLINSRKRFALCRYP